jgi:hypothetical protein
MIKTKIHGETMTVGELIKELSKYDKNMAVLTEGCDCWGNVSSLMILEEGILLERNN